MMNRQEINDYLERIAYRGPSDASAAVFSALHLAHVRSVPFENLDIRLGIQIELAFETIYDKVVRRRRGGFCYELNFTFAALLASLGFETSLLSAQVWSGEQYSPAFDHMLLHVRVEQRSWIADVGFGDCFLEPLLLDGEETIQAGVGYSLREDGEQSYVLLHRKEHRQWEPIYRFSLQACGIADFAPRCLYQQTSPASHFTQKSVCSMATGQGRVTLSNDKLIETADGTRSLHTVRTETEYRRVLEEKFQLLLPLDAAIGSMLLVK